ncbi:hypothetical protein ABZ864_45460 [Streptomyces sp. NPDC047082]|uniref:hypothetical protein n=1 Tax=Streptomyces sp. NPDC047082 TaxID=3155259 RepID=UPI0033D0CA9F
MGTAAPETTGKPSTSPYVLPTGTPAARSGPESRNSSRLVNQREIDSYVLGLKDVPGSEIATNAGRTTAGTEMPVRLFTGNLPRISPSSCQHVYENSQQAGAYRQYARTDNIISGHGTALHVALIAYRPGDAHKVLADLRAALPGCTSYAGPVDMTQGFEHPQLLPDPHLGDEALEYGIMEKISDEQGTVRAPFHYLLVRKGSVIAWFEVQALPGETVALPMHVINTQLANLP